MRQYKSLGPLVKGEMSSPLVAECLYAEAFESYGRFQRNWFVEKPPTKGSKQCPKVHFRDFNLNDGSACKHWECGELHPLGHQRFLSSSAMEVP